MRPTTSLLKLAQTAYKAPATLPVPSAAAFSLVRDLLAQRPRHFRELLIDGVGAQITPANVYPAGARMKAKGKGKAVIEEVAVDVPKEHPFVSGSYLKKHILPVLASQKLIAKEWRAAEAGSALEHAHRPHTDKLHSMWVLQQDDKATGRWDNLTSGTVTRRLLSQQGREVFLEAKAAEAAEKEARFARGEEKRSDKDVMEWAGRPKGFTVQAERLHLNRRRARRRTFKEQLAVSKPRWQQERAERQRLTSEMLKQLRGADA